MDPLTLSLIVGGAQAGIGALQRRAARKRREKALADFNYEIPSAVTEQVQQAKEKASRRGLPGEDITRGRLESDLARTVSKGEGVAETPGDILGLYAKSFGQKGDIATRILEGGAKYQAEREHELTRAMGAMADAQQQQFHYNKYMPFMSEMGFAGQQSMGGAQNIAAGFQTGVGGVMNKMQMDQMKELYGQMNNNNQQPFDWEAYNKSKYALLPAAEEPMGMEDWITDEDIWKSEQNPYTPKPLYGSDKPYY